jgi:hypothetical protein
MTGGLDVGHWTLDVGSSRLQTNVEHRTLNIQRRSPCVRHWTQDWGIGRRVEKGGLAPMRNCTSVTR